NAQAAARMMAQGSDDREEIQEILSEIISADKHAGEIIRNMRGLLKKSAGRVEALELPDVVHEVERLLHSDLVSRGVSRSTDFAAGLPRVSGDRVQIAQVLVNLVTNACDAMSQSGSERRLRISAQPENGNGAAVLVSVADSGCGIRPDDLERLFQPFV